MAYRYNPFTNRLDYYDPSSGGTVTSVSGTTNRITVTNPTTTPVIDIAATYVGQTSITTLGTVTTGTWNGTAIGAIYGGTAQTTYATGDILYASAANTLSKLAATTNGFVLTLAAGVPSWAAATPPSYDVSNYSGGKTYTFDDYLQGSTSADLGWATSNQNGGAATKGNLDRHLGTLECSTGIATNGASMYRLNGVQQIGGVAFKFGFYIKIPVLSDGTDTFLVELGMIQGLFATTAITDGVFFSYTHGTNSGKWLINNKASSVSTPLDSGVAGSTNWTYFEISVNAAGTSVSYYINGVQTSNSPDTANIPVGVDLTFFYRINKTAGTNARVVTGDNFYLITNP